MIATNPYDKQRVLPLNSDVYKRGNPGMAFLLWIKCMVYFPNAIVGMYVMVTSSNEKKIRVTGPLSGDRWITLIKASDAELWCFLWSAPE